MQVHSRTPQHWRLRVICRRFHRRNLVSSIVARLPRGNRRLHRPFEHRPTIRASIKRILEAALCRVGSKPVGMAPNSAMALTPQAHDRSNAALIDPAVDELTDAPASFPIANPDKPQAACV